MQRMFIVKIKRFSGSSSKTGELKDRLPKGEYYVTAVLTKGDERLESENTKISILNLDVNVLSIKGYTMKNLGGYDSSNEDEFIRNSNILVVGERANIDSLSILIGNETCTVSSDITVISKNRIH